jgi:hypothetical protein
MRTKIKVGHVKSGTTDVSASPAERHYNGPEQVYFPERSLDTGAGCPSFAVVLYTGVVSV